MANRLFEKGKEGFLDGLIDWDTNLFSAVLLDLDTADVGVRQIVSSTNATPIVVTSTAHGLLNGDVVSITGHLVNLAANGIWKIANVAANTFELTDPITGGNVVGSGVGGATGRVVCLGPSAAGDMFDDFNACLVGAKVNLTGATGTNGIADANDTTFTSVTGASCEAIGIFQDTTVDSTSRMVALIDGRQIVTCAAAPSGTYTSLAVERLLAGIPNGTVLTFSNGQAVTLNAVANAGDRLLTVVSTAVAVTAGARADAPATGSGLPVTPNGNNIVVTWDNGANRIFAV